MTRIVGGLARGRILAVPESGTRPTSDRAREGLFNSLRAQLDLDGARVLDLFAGSGAVGLEALSNGARSVVLVESDRRAGAVITANIDAVGLPGAVLACQAAHDYLCGPAPDTPFDVVFLDPPYALGEDELAILLGLLARPALLSEAGLVVVERLARGPEPTWPDGLLAIRHRRYGEAMLWYGRRCDSR